jgi:hypothetical protein
MTDIVERLRAWDHDPTILPRSVMHDAAAEIERLRAALHEAARELRAAAAVIAAMDARP